MRIRSGTSTLVDAPTIAGRYSVRATFALFFTVLVSSALLSQHPDIVFLLYTTLLATALWAGASAANIEGIGAAILVFLMFAFANLIGNFLFPGSLIPFARMFLVIATLTCGWLYAGLRGGSTRAMVHGISAGSVIVIVYYLSLLNDPKNFEFDRFGGGGENHSNLIGLNCYVMVVALVASGQRWLAPILTPVTLWVLSIAQSRTSLGLAAAYLLYTAFLRLIKKDPLYTAIALGCVVFGLLIDIGAGEALYGKSLVLSTLDGVFMFSDEYRGLSTGFVGRTELWAQTFDIFAQNPVFGVGLGQHQEYGNLPLSGHSLYLITLAEGGVIGFAAFLILSAVGILGLIKARSAMPTRSEERNHYDAFVFLACSYFVYGLVERRGINISNALSFVFFYIIGAGWRWALARGTGALVRNRPVAADRSSEFLVVTSNTELKLRV